MSETIVRGSELTRELLKSQKYVLCLVHNISDNMARSSVPPKVRTVSEVEGIWFHFTDGLFAEYAVPIDNNGNEVVALEEVSLSELSYGLWEKKD